MNSSVRQINGKTIITANDVSIEITENGTVYIGGCEVRTVDGKKITNSAPVKPVEQTLKLDANSTLHGDITGDIKIVGENVTLTVRGDVVGNITSAGSVVVEGDTIGNINSHQR